MNKSCNDCYFKSKDLDIHCFNYDNQPDKVCDYFTPECECGYEGDYLYNDTYYCKQCILKEFGVETYTVEHYMLNGEYLGDDNDLDEVIENLSSNIIRVDE